MWKGRYWQVFKSALVYFKSVKYEDLDNEMEESGFSFTFLRKLENRCKKVNE